MKKYLSIIFLLVLIVPSIALASWWNPLSWFNNWSFHKQEIIPQIQEIDQTTKSENTESVNSQTEEINKLKKQIEELKNQKPNDKVNTKEIQIPTVTKPTEKNMVENISPIVNKIITLQIINVKSQNDQGVTTITWETNVPSESRLFLLSDIEKGYESENGLGTKHLVKILNTVKDKEYNYKITATTEDKKSYDDIYGLFIGGREYIVYLGKYNSDNKCQIIKVKDGSGRLAAGQTVEIISYSEIVTTGGTFKVTDLNGEVNYCTKYKNIKVLIDGEDDPFNFSLTPTF